MYNDFYNSYQTAEWQRLKNKVLERDNYTCQICGEKESLLNVHHITYKNCRGLAYNAPMGDLITLCSTCHSADDGDHKHFFNGLFVITPKGYFGSPVVQRTICYEFNENSYCHRWDFMPFEIVSLDGDGCSGRAIGFFTWKELYGGVDEHAWFPYLTNIEYSGNVWAEDDWLASQFKDQRLATVDEVISFVSRINDPVVEKCIESHGIGNNEYVFIVNSVKWTELNQKTNSLILKDCSDLLF